MSEVALVFVGLAAGSMGAALGVGGGIVYVPALASLFAFAQHDAQGTSLAVIVPSTIVAAVVHSRAGRVDWRTALILGCGGIAGGVIGAWIAIGLDARTLQRLFALLLVFTAVRMLRHTRRRAHAPLPDVPE